jgi:hypothetical protein
MSPEGCVTLPAVMGAPPPRVGAGVMGHTLQSPVDCSTRLSGSSADPQAGSATTLRCGSVRPCPLAQLLAPKVAWPSWTAAHLTTGRSPSSQARFELTVVMTDGQRHRYERTDMTQPLPDGQPEGRPYPVVVDDSTGTFLPCAS